MKRLVSGIKPTGEIHIGNYIGAIRQWLELSSKYESYYFIADLHALTVRPKPEELQRLTFNLVALLLALGLDPKKTTFFLQSAVPAHTELSWILSNSTFIGQLNRMTQYKEKADRYGQNAGLFYYPILMTADVLAYQAEVVPVGDDQVQHLELTREIARNFNNRYGRIFVEPQPILTSGARIMSLHNPKTKMSKSIERSAIGFTDSDETIIQTIKKAVTDSDPKSRELSPAIKNLLAILEGIGADETHRAMLELHQSDRLRYSELKEALTEELIGFIAPIRRAYTAIRQDEPRLVKAISHGAARAQETSQATLKKVKQAVGLLS